MLTITIKGPVRSGKTLVANQIAALLANSGATVRLDGVPVLPGTHPLDLRTVVGREDVTIVEATERG